MNRLKELRKEKKLTQKELADIIGTTKLTISNWENGKHSINSNKADKLSSFFDVSVGYLLGHTGNSLSISGNLKAGDKINLRGTIATIDETLILFQTEAGYTIWLNREAVEKSSERRNE